MNYNGISAQTLRRLPVYLHYLCSIRDGAENISATSIAEALGLNDVQVRKDLAAISGSGRPRVGYEVRLLISQLQEALNYNKETRTVLIGAGHLGKALLSYSGFSDYGLNIVAAFDVCQKACGGEYNGKPVLPMDGLEDFLRTNDIPLAIITVPASAAQELCDRLVNSGVKAIWNFAPIMLKAPGEVIIENENLASSLAVLSNKLHGQWKTEDEK